MKNLSQKGVAGGGAFLNKPELLSPVGSMEGLLGVIRAGCDAVYLAGKDFGARAYAENFSDEELLSALNICHLFGKKLYLTVNTLLKEEELNVLPSFLKPLVGAHLDGVIVMDAGVIRVLGREFPDLPLHASTQLSVSSPYAARLLKERNVTRIVPARELSLKEIIGLKEKAGVEVETFIHGAMCYSYSGRCLMSSCLGERSGNRGRCSQPCRLPYRSGENGLRSEAYILSMKDLYTADILPEIVSAGIDSLKIEGRMKKPVYAVGVTALYRKYIDRILDGGFDGIEPSDEKLMKTLYMRSGLSHGYYHEKNGPLFVTFDVPGYSGAEEESIQKVTETYLRDKPRLSITGNAVFEAGKEALLSLSFTDPSTEKKHEAVAKGIMVQEAKNAPVTEEKIREQLLKTGDSFFRFDELRVNMQGRLFLPVSALNELRRSAFSALEEEILRSYE